MKKAFQSIEHGLIPLALAILTIGVMHVLYLLSVLQAGFRTSIILVFIAIILLGLGVRYKHKWLLAGGSVSYLVLLVISLNY